MQVLYRCTSFLRSWSTLQRVGFRDLFTETCARLEEGRGIFLSDMDGHLIAVLDHHRRSSPPSVLAFYYFTP